MEKSTIANVLMTKFLEVGGRPVTMLNGDLVQQHLSSELGFSKERRDINIRRIGYVASEITKNGGIAICAPIAPYDLTRKDVRALINQSTAASSLFISPLPWTCARPATAKAFMPRRAPASSKNSPASAIPTRNRLTPDYGVDTAELSPEEAAQEIVLHLEREGSSGITATGLTNKSLAAAPLRILTQRQFCFRARGKRVTQRPPMS